MHVQKVICPKCYAPTERLRGAMGMQDRRCPACKYEGRGRWQFAWDNHEAPMNRKELDRLKVLEADENRKMVEAQRAQAEALRARPRPNIEEEQALIEQFKHENPDDPTTNLSYHLWLLYQAKGGALDYKGWRDAGRPEE